jgi:hypothetical protein
VRGSISFDVPSLARSLASRIRDGLLRALDPSRRYNCQQQDSPIWEERAVQAVALLMTSSVGTASGGRFQIDDFGAGNQRLLPNLNRELEAPFDYQADDLHPQVTEVLRFDLERELPNRVFDAVFCLGLLEYLRDEDRFVSRLRRTCRYAVVSYVLSDAPASLPAHERRKRGWLNDYTRSGLEQLFRSKGFEFGDFTAIQGGTTGLWLWTREDLTGPG